MTYLEKIPAHCQQLQVLVKSPTVGKSATFTKIRVSFYLMFSFVENLSYTVMIVLLPISP